MIENIPLSVKLDGRTIEFEGWMFVLAAALRGCEWAIEEAEKPGFRDRIRESMKKREIKALEGVLERKLDEVEAIRKELKGLKAC